LPTADALEKNNWASGAGDYLIDIFGNPRICFPAEMYFIILVIHIFFQKFIRKDPIKT
jgi:hypothetical protein